VGIKGLGKGLRVSASFQIFDFRMLLHSVGGLPVGGLSLGGNLRGHVPWNHIP